MLAKLCVKFRNMGMSISDTAVMASVSRSIEGVGTNCVAIGERQVLMWTLVAGLWNVILVVMII